jgi:hypothetical protein
LSSERSSRTCAAACRRAARDSRALEQAAALGPCRVDDCLGVALCRGDGVRRVAFGRENPVDRPCNGCIG